MEQYATSLGGEKGVAQGYGSVIIGGSTGKDAIDAVAIGPSSVVTAIHGTAVGYQSTTNQSDTIAFGHDADDVSGYTVTWQQRTDTDSEGHIVKNADGTTNDYTKAPTVTENKYTSSYYNRLVKVADGQSAHDVATVGQTVELVAGDHVKVEADTTATNMIGQQRKKISILTNGKIEKGNTGLVTGDAINTALSAETTARQNADTTLNKQLTTTNKNVSDLQTAMKQKADTSLSNLTDAGRTAVKDIMKDDLSKKADVSTVYTKTEVDSQVSGLRTDLAGKADTNLSNLTDAGKTAVKNIMKDDLSKKADASSVYTKTEVDSQVSGLRTDFAGKADTNLSNLTDAGKTAVKNIMKDDLSKKADASSVYTKTEVDSQVSGLKTDLTGKADASLSNLTDAGKTAVKDIMKEDLSKKADVSTVYTKTEVDGQVSGLKTDLAGKADTNLSNLTDAGKTAVKDIMKDDLSKKADVSSVYTKTEVDSQVSGLKTDLAGKADASLSNLTDAGKTAVKDIMKDDLAQKADKSTVYTKAETYNRTEIDGKVSGLTTDIAGKADTSLSNLTDAGKTAVKDIMKDDLAQKADKSTVYTKAETYNRTEIDGKVSGLTTNIAGKADTSLSNLTDAGKTAVKDIMKDDMAQKVDKSAANLSADDVKNWQDKLGNGNIARGDHGLISGGKVFEALQGVGNYGLVKSDGKVVNIAKDDSAKVIDVSGAGTNRVITGVKTDVRDPSSAANVAYVNGNTQQIYQDMNQAYGSLRNDISRAAASSNALAALKPMEFDSDDKLQFGIGYGHYHNANAAAVGAFYQPDENCMMNLGASIGNGNPGVSAGITIKFGPGGSGAPMLSKRQMAKIIQNQSVQLDEQSKEIESLKQENQEMKEQLKAILDKLNK